MNLWRLYLRMKASTATKSAKPTASPFPAMADELGALVKEMAPYKAKLARIEALKKALRAGCPVPPQSGWTVEGLKFVAVLSACGSQRIIDIPKLVKTISAAVFAKFASCSLDTLEKNVAPAVLASVVYVENTGPRSLDTYERATPA